MATEAWFHYRGAAGSLSRSRQPDDPELVRARTLMYEETLVDAVAKVLARAPALRPEARERVLALLADHPVAQ